MKSWFTEAIEEHQEILRRQSVGQALTDRERDEFRRRFELAIETVAVPEFESFVSAASEHEFPTSIKKEVDSAGRLRAIVISLIPRRGADPSDNGCAQCMYKIAIQMTTRRIAHMIYLDNAPNVTTPELNDFTQLTSISSEYLQQRLRRFLEFALSYYRSKVR